jgi:iron complex transport system substrate-binding protein
LASVVDGCREADRTPEARQSLRVVSLSPAVTQMVVDLGLGEEIVGVGAQDPAAPPGLEVVGDLYQIDFERLVRAAPTHVFLQPGRQGVPPRLDELARVRGWQVLQYEIETVRNALEALYDARTAFPERTVGGALGVRDRARKLVVEIRARLNRLADLHRGRTVEDVLLLVGLNPITAVGRDTFLDELLAIAGGKNALPAGGERYPVIDLERVATLRPQVVVLVSPAQPAQSGEEKSGAAQAAALLKDTGAPAVAAGRVYGLEDPLALLPSTSMPRVAGRLARILHPESIPRIAEVLGEDLGEDFAR